MKNLLTALVFMLLICGESDAQIIYNFGTTGGTLNTNGSSGVNPVSFNNYPTTPTGVKFFYGFSANANATLKGSAPGLSRLGDSTEVQACGGNGNDQFCKFGILKYSSQGTLFSYVKFDMVFAGDSLASSFSNTGVWYFFIGDGGTTSQFMANDTISKKLNESAASFRWTFTTNGGLNFARYDCNSLTWVDISDPSISWAQKKKYTLEIYANTNKNSSNSSIIFKRAGIQDTLGPKTMSVYVNNYLLAHDVNVSQYDNQTLSMKKVDSYCWYGEGSNNSWIFVDNAAAEDAAPSTYAWYTVKPANGTTLDLSLLSSWTSSYNGIGGTAPTTFDSLNTTWFIRNYNGSTGVSVTLSSGNLSILKGLNSQFQLGDSGQTATFRIPSGKSCLGDMDVRSNGYLLIESSSLPNIRTTNSNSTVEYNNSDAVITYPLYYNLKITSGTKTVGSDFIIDGTATVGDGSNATYLIIPYNHSFTGNVNVSANGKLTIQHTSIYPTIGTLATGSTVEYSGPSQQTSQSGAAYYNLIVNNSGGLLLGGDLSVGGILTLLSNVVLNGKSLTLNGTVSSSGGTFTGSSSSNMIIGGTGDLGTISFTNGSRLLNNLTLDRTTYGTATLGTYLNVQGALTLNNGLLKINSTNDSLTLGSSTSSPGTLNFPQSGPNYTSWIYGKFQRYVSAGAGSVFFPIGSLTYWEGVNLLYGSNTSTGGTLSAQFILGDPGTRNSSNLIDDTEPGNPNYVIDRYSRYGYWSVKNSGVTGTYEINLNAYNFFGINSNSDIQRQKLRIIKRANSDSLWTLQGSHVSGNGTATQMTVKRSGLTYFSEFTLAAYSLDNALDNTPMPVSLQSFVSGVNGRNATLNWITTSEINNDGFYIERKNEKNTWINIGFVKGAGNSSTANKYTFEDKNLKPGIYEYRLKQKDINGNIEYFNLNNYINIASPEKYSLSQNYPNPFNPKTKIDFALPCDSKVTLAIYDISGRVISVLINNESRKADFYTVEFNASSYASGVYFYKLTAGSFTRTNKMVLVK